MTEATETETEGKLEYKLLFDISLWSPIICVILDMEMQCRNLIQMVCKSNNFILNVFMKRCLVLLKKKKIIWLKVLLKNIFLSSLALWNFSNVMKLYNTTIIILQLLKSLVINYYFRNQICVHQPYLMVLVPNTWNYCPKWLFLKLASFNTCLLWKIYRALR